MDKQTIQSNMDQMQAQNKRKRKYSKALAVAALVVAFVTIYALILPGVTMEHSAPICGKQEHAHGDACYNQVQVCALPEGTAHVHTGACYDDAGSLGCGVADGLHMHLTSCFNDQGKAVCGLEEAVHIHTPACFDGEGALICESEAAHVHGATCYDADGSLICEEPSAGHVHTALCYQPMETLTCTVEDPDHEHGPECYTTANELICGQEEAVEIDHQHGEGCYTKELNCTIEEHAHDEVCYDVETYHMIQAGDANKEQIKAEEEAGAPVEGEAVSGGEFAQLAAAGLAYEDDKIQVVFDVPEDLEGELKLTVTEGDEAAESTTDDRSAELYVLPEMETEDVAASDEDAPAWTVDLHINATLDGELVEDISELGITAKMMVKPQAVEPILNEMDLENVAEEIKDEVGVEVTFAQPAESDEATPLSEQEEDAEETVVINSADASTFDLPLKANNLLAKASSTANPNFTVQYYAYVPLLEQVDEDTGANSLPVIDTSGGQLPQNGVTPSVKYLTLNNDGVVQTIDTLSQIYTNDEYEYFPHPSLKYFDKLQKNDNYTLSKIWVLKEGKDPSSLDEADWTVYETDCKFTNNIQYKDEEGYIYIGENFTLRLVSTCSNEETDSKPASFYDYDITDGYIYASASDAASQKNKKQTSTQNSSIWYANTGTKGINSGGNYTGSGVRYGFGNNNTNTGLGTNVWDGNELNKYNNKNKNDKANGCTFGLVTGYDSVGKKIQYTNGVSVPNLFDDGVVSGKTEYSGDGNSLTFSRIGDTYTLTSATVKDKTLNGLEKFSHPGKYDGVQDSKSIWTNGFWPMDNAPSHGTNGHDLKFGNTDLAKNRRYGASEWTALPTSDDGLDHNSYFGMHYTVDFEFDSDYCGPLEYLFFGDDDLWVFLDGKLVLDIGGVHSSVGEYVNLWDYLDRETDAGKEHTLSIFYTERGASGSTCFMNFTLPSVTSDAVAQDTAAIQISKDAQGNGFTSGDEFEFTIELTDESDSPLVNEYPFTKEGYNANGVYEVLESGKIVSGNIFKLKDDQFIEIEGLPQNARYKITEANYEPKVSINGIPQEGSVAESGIIKRVDVIDFVNYKYALPATGGLGTNVIVLVGSAFILVAFILHLRKRHVKIDAKE